VLSEARESRVKDQPMGGKQGKKTAKAAPEAEGQLPSKPKKRGGNPGFQQGSFLEKPDAKWGGCEAEKGVEPGLEEKGFGGKKKERGESWERVALLLSPEALNAPGKLHTVISGGGIWTWGKAWRKKGERGEGGKAFYVQQTWRPHSRYERKGQLDKRPQADGKGGEKLGGGASSSRGGGPLHLLGRTGRLERGEDEE